VEEKLLILERKEKERRRGRFRGTRSKICAWCSGGKESKPRSDMIGSDS